MLFVKQTTQDRRGIASYTLEARLCENFVTECCTVVQSTASAYVGSWIHLHAQESGVRQPFQFWY